MKDFIGKFGFWMLTSALGINLWFAKAAWEGVQRSVDQVRAEVKEVRTEMNSQGAGFLEMRIETAVLKNTVNDMREKLRKGAR